MTSVIDPAEATLLAVAGLAPASESAVQLTPADFDRFLAGAWSGNLDGFAVAAVRDGRLLLDPEQRRRLSDVHRQGMEQVLRMERTLGEVGRAFDAAGVQFAVLKGLALANWVYPDPSLRPTSDVDLFVAPDGIELALAVLSGLGATRAIPEVRRGHDRRFGKDVPVVLDGAEIDVHARLVIGPFGHRIPSRALLARRVMFVASGVALCSFDVVDSYLFAALTAGAADDPPRLLTMCDLLELERQPGFDPTNVLSRAAEWGVAAPLARAIRLLGAFDPPTGPPALLDWALDYRPARRDRLLLRSYLGPGRSYRSHLAGVSTIEGWSSRARFLRDLAVPQASYRAARRWTRYTHIGRAMNALRPRKR